MKRFYLLILLSIVIQSIGFCQNQINLNIIHKLNDQDFRLNQNAKNNLDQEFYVTRLQYYISEITLIHDGAQEKRIENLWILVNASGKTQINLGNQDVNYLESIKFYVGVDPDHNHLDPSMYSNGHPLAPMFPSMHWGWAAGYRFVAMEGFCGPGLNQKYELHALGDDNYFMTEALLNQQGENGIISVEIFADYAKALENISIQSGLIVHGDNLQAVSLLENFRDNVFSGNEFTSSISDSYTNSELSIFPNPSIDGTLNFEMTGGGIRKYELIILNEAGAEVRRIKNVNKNKFEFSCLLDNGIYFINVLCDGKIIESQKVVVL